MDTSIFYASGLISTSAVYLVAGSSTGITACDLAVAADEPPMSPPGTFRALPLSLTMSVVGSKADSICSGRAFPLLTQLRHPSTVGAWLNVPLFKATGKVGRNRDELGSGADIYCGCGLLSSPIDSAWLPNAEWHGRAAIAVSGLSIWKAQPACGAGS